MKPLVSCLISVALTHPRAPGLSSWAAGHSSRPPTAHARPARPLPCWRMITGRILAGNLSWKNGMLMLKLLRFMKFMKLDLLVVSKIVKEHVLFGVWLTLSSWSCHFLAKEASAWMSVAVVFPCISVAMAKYRLSGQHPLWHPVSPQSSKEWQVSTTSLHSKSRRESRKPQRNKATYYIFWYIIIYSDVLSYIIIYHYILLYIRMESPLDD